MTIPNDVKLPLLRSFYLKLEEPGWNFSDSKEKDRIVLEEFSNIQTEFKLLDSRYVNCLNRFRALTEDFLISHLTCNCLWLG